MRTIRILGGVVILIALVGITVYLLWSTGQNYLPGADLDRRQDNLALCIETNNPGWYVVESGYENDTVHLSAYLKRGITKSNVDRLFHYMASCAEKYFPDANKLTLYLIQFSLVHTADDNQDHVTANIAIEIRLSAVQIEELALTEKPEEYINRQDEKGLLDFTCHACNPLAPPVQHTVRPSWTYSLRKASADFIGFANKKD